MSSDSVSPNSRPARILCVDDEPAIRDVLCALLRREGFVAEGAGNGMEAWHKLTAAGSDYALLITDNDMPGLNGSGLVQKARAAGVEVKIMVFSASLTPGDEAAFQASGVDAIVAKGSAIDELLGTVRRLVGVESAGERGKIQR